MNGTIIFKLIMAEINYLAYEKQTICLRENISSLDTYMSSVNAKIEELNFFVKFNYEGIKDQG